MWNREPTTKAYTLLLASISAVLGFIAGLRLIELLLEFPAFRPGAFLVAAAQIPFLAVMTIVGYKLSHEPKWNTDQARRITLWCTAGLTGFVVINVLVMTLSPPDGWWDATIWVGWAAALGGGAGILTGYYEAKAIQRARAKEREAIRAEEAEAREELLDYLNSLLRHEVLNSATVIQGYAEHLTIENDFDDDVEETLATIENQSVEMTEIIKDVRVLLKASKQGNELERLDLRHILDKELRKVTERFPEVETEITAPDSVSIMGDPLLRRIFTNLFSNAVEHNDSDTPRITVTVTPEDETVTVRVADNGPGFPEDDREDLFEPKTGGSPDHGLGLMLVKKLVDRYHGEIELTDTGADGTVFTVTFPRPSEETPDTPSPVVDDAPKAEPDSPTDRTAGSVLSPVSND